MQGNLARGHRDSPPGSWATLAGGGCAARPRPGGRSARRWRRHRVPRSWSPRGAIIPAIPLDPPTGARRCVWRVWDPWAMWCPGRRADPSAAALRTLGSSPAATADGESGRGGGTGPVPPRVGGPRFAGGGVERSGRGDMLRCPDCPGCPSHSLAVPGMSESRRLTHHPAAGQSKRRFPFAAAPLLAHRAQGSG
jgi:hypothetical protein